ncbi:NitT/TauT family transport system permease protein [Desulfuromusa kysingii]|uniref:NitT/TauT family transport system permease protein n=1 Tax=Desulfuromusa kysingii TaxID=37625 RepID=A0A1H3XMK9_9BACT|nr:ABC transporter permease [Desulfuromusa kysingii]SEA00695.1 NitT/TauT family transport system permease protein [Desulfuromusa kysingii]
MGRKRDIFIAAIILVLTWEVVALLLDSMALPQPWEVIADFLLKIADGRLVDDFFISALRAVLGIFLAFVVAVPLGLVVGAAPSWRKRISPFIYLLYPIPHVVLLPLVIILFGIGEFSKIFLIALIVFFQVLVTTRDGAKNIHQNYFYSMQTLGATPFQVYRHLVLPATLPKILTAMRISIGTAIAILFFVESFATAKGLGYIIMDSWGQSDYISLYTGIFSMAILGFILYMLLDRIEQWVCRWQIVR